MIRQTFAALTAAALTAAGVLAASAAPALAQSGDDAYGGHRPGAFYDLDRREAAIEGRIRDAAEHGEIGGVQARRAFAQLRAIRGEEAFRRGRHDGELRDWDRELLTRRLDQLAAGLPR